MNNFMVYLSVIAFLSLLKFSIPTAKQKKRRLQRRSQRSYSFQKNPILLKTETVNSEHSLYKTSSTVRRQQPTSSNLNNLDTINWDKNFLTKLEWKLFEDICLEYLRIKNCNANVTCTGADGGIDIKVRDSTGTVIAIGQCKAWNKPIGVGLIRELFGVMASEQVKHGIFLTTSIFSNEAKEFAKNKNLMLINGEELAKNIDRLSNENKLRIEKLIKIGDFSTPTCVHCNVKLIKRTVKTGVNAGKEFWGCANYPRCKITMKIVG